MSFSASISGHIQQMAHPGAAATDEEIKEFEDSQKAATDMEQAIFDDLAGVVEKYKDVVTAGSFGGSHVSGPLFRPEADTTNEDGSLTEAGRVEQASEHQGLAN